MYKKIITTVVVGGVLGGGLWISNNTINQPLKEIPVKASTISASVILDPAQPMAGEETILNFSFTNPDGSLVDDLMKHHGRRVHTLIISEDLASIGHIHPQDFTELTDGIIKSGEYSVKYTFPRAGRYIVGVDVMNMESSLSKQFVIDVKGDSKMGSVTLDDMSLSKCFRGYDEQGTDRYVDTVFISESEVDCPLGYKVTMIPSVENISSGEEVQLAYRIEKDGAPVMDLESYLDAAIHFAIVPVSFDTVLHRHGEPKMHHEEEIEEMEEMHDDMDSMEMSHHHESVVGHFGPELISESISFPNSGKYQVFAQFKHDGKIIFSNFLINVD